MQNQNLVHTTIQMIGVAFVTGLFTVSGICISAKYNFDSERIRINHEESKLKSEEVREEAKLKSEERKVKLDFFIARCERIWQLSNDINSAYLSSFPTADGKTDQYSLRKLKLYAHLAKSYIDETSDKVSTAAIDTASKAGAGLESIYIGSIMALSSELKDCNTHDSIPKDL